MRANLSILGLYRADPTIFDDMSLPETVDKESVIDTIIMDCAELEIVFPDSDFMKRAIEVWSFAQLKNWNRIAESLEYGINPLNNFDRHDIVEGTLLSKNPGYNSAELVEAGESKNDSHVHSYGYNGSMSPGRILQENLATMAYTNIYGIISADFKNRFCLLVY